MKPRRTASQQPWAGLWSSRLGWGWDGCRSRSGEGQCWGAQTLWDALTFH